MNKNLIASLLMGAACLTMAAPALAAGDIAGNAQGGQFRELRIQNTPSIEGCTIGLRKSESEDWTCSVAPPPAPPPLPTPPALPDILGFSQFVTFWYGDSGAIKPWDRFRLNLRIQENPFLKTRFGMFVGQGGGDGGGVSQIKKFNYTYLCVPGPSRVGGRYSRVTFYYSDGTTSIEGTVTGSELCSPGYAPQLQNRVEIPPTYANDDTGGGS